MDYYIKCKDDYGNLGKQIFSGKTNSSGKVFLDDTSTSNSTLYFQVSKTEGETNYQQLCPTPLVYKKTLNPSACDTKTVNLGIVPIKAQSWKSVIDGDIYASGIDVDISGYSPKGEFTNNLINQRQEGSGGYVFNTLDITTPLDRIIEDKGGYTLNLGENHNDKALDLFSFKPPDHDLVEEINTLSHDFTPGGVYKISVDDFNDSAESDVLYSLSSGIAVVYVLGDTEAVLKGSIQSLGSGRLILVIQPDLYISKDIGYDTTLSTYTIDSTPNIQAAIISKGNIIFEDLLEDTKIGQDIPIMVTGPLVSKLNIDLKRDLGFNNANYPAISVNHDQTLMCEVSQLEKEHLEYRNYTGLRTFDVQFDYEY